MSENEGKFVPEWAFPPSVGGWMTLWVIFQIVLGGFVLGNAVPVDEYDSAFNGGAMVLGMVLGALASIPYLAIPVVARRVLIGLADVRSRLGSETP